MVFPRRSLAVRRDRVVAIPFFFVVASISACGFVGYERLSADQDGSGDAASDASDGGTIGTCTLVPSDDGMIDLVGLLADVTGLRMISDDDGSAAHHTSYIRFDLGGACREGGALPAGVTLVAASLVLVVAPTCTGTCSMTTQHKLRRLDTTWSEGSLSPGSPPTADATVTASMSTAPGDLGASVSFAGDALRADVAAMLASPSTNFGWQISPVAGSPGGAGWAFDTRESGSPPTLVLTYQMP